MKNLWTKRNILDYLSYPEESLDKNYSPIRQKYKNNLEDKMKRQKYRVG